MKISYAIVLGFLSLGQNGALATVGTVVMDRYPSAAEAAKLLKMGAKSLVVRADARPNQQGYLEYPSRVHGDHLNDLDRLSITIEPLVTHFPSSSNAVTLNKLKDHVSVDVTIGNCLSSTSERDRLIAVKRAATFRVNCIGKNAYERAQKLAEKVLQKSPRLTIDVRWSKE